MVYFFDDPKSGYGWLGLRVKETYPPQGLDIVVATPYDATYLFPEAFEGGKKPLVLCACDGTDFPPCWLSLLDKFAGVILMLDHSNLKEKYPEVIKGEWFPKLRFWGRQGVWKPRERVFGTIAQMGGRKGLQFLPTILSRCREFEFEVLTDHKTAIYLLPITKSFPNLKVIESNLSDDELMDWFLSLRAFFSLSMGEGGGLPAFEASYLGVPSILPYHTAYKFVPYAVFYPCTPVTPFDLQLGGNIFSPDLDGFISILKGGKIPGEQNPQPPPFPVEPPWEEILKSL